MSQKYLSLSLCGMFLLSCFEANAGGKQSRGHITESCTQPTEESPRPTLQRRGGMEKLLKPGQDPRNEALKIFFLSLRTQSKGNKDPLHAIQIYRDALKTIDEFLKDGIDAQPHQHLIQHELAVTLYNSLTKDDDLERTYNILEEVIELCKLARETCPIPADQTLQLALSRQAQTICSLERKISNISFSERVELKEERLDCLDETYKINPNQKDTLITARRSLGTMLLTKAHSFASPDLAEDDVDSFTRSLKKQDRAEDYAAYSILLFTSALDLLSPTSSRRLATESDLKKAQDLLDTLFKRYYTSFTLNFESLSAHNEKVSLCQKALEKTNMFDEEGSSIASSHKPVLENLLAVTLWDLINENSSPENKDMPLKDLESRVEAFEEIIRLLRSSAHCDSDIQENLANALLERAYTIRFLTETQKNPALLFSEKLTLETEMVAHLEELYTFDNSLDRIDIDGHLARSYHILGVTLNAEARIILGKGDKGLAKDYFTQASEFFSKALPLSQETDDFYKALEADFKNVTTELQKQFWKTRQDTKRDLKKK